MYIPALARRVQSLLKPTWARFVGRMLRAFVLSIVVLFATAIVYEREIIGRIFRNVIDTSDGEMPINVASFPSGPEVVSIIGGSGHGLNCSLPPMGDALFGIDLEGNSKRRSLVRQRFRQACVFHDLCYRHGLATYGYSQNECDRILQDHAHRLCFYFPGGRFSADHCQHETKRLLAGVSIGGFESFRARDDSTYFEFDTSPIRSQQFTAHRVVNHPFKSASPEKYKHDPDQMIVAFSTRRDTVSARCENCPVTDPAVYVLALPKDATDGTVSDEFRSVGIKSRPEALRNRSLAMHEQRSVWLPPGRIHAAPYLMADSRGEHHLIWLSRSRLDDTGSCMVFTNARQLFTYTLPQTRVCSSDANRYLKPFDVDTLSSSPLPMIVPSNGPSDDIVVLGLTVQTGRQRNLTVCGWNEGRLKIDDTSRRMRSGCVSASRVNRDQTPVVAVDERGSRLGAFQNFPVIRAGQAIYFERDIWTDPPEHLISRLFERMSGRPLSPNGKLLLVNIKQGASWSGLEPPMTVDLQIPFRIDDTYDPMMPLSAANDDLRFLSIVSSKSRASIHLTNFTDDKPQPVAMGTRIGGETLVLHESWVRRPVHVVEPKNEVPEKSQLIFARSVILPSDAPGAGAPGNGASAVSKPPPSDRVRFQFSVLERDRAAKDNEPWAFRRGATCDVNYTLNHEEAETSCARTFDPDRRMRESPATMLQGTQLLVGRFRNNRLAVALMDACIPREPIVFDPEDSAGKSFGSLKPVSEFTTVDIVRNRITLNRRVKCMPLADGREIAAGMNTGGIEQLR